MIDVVAAETGEVRPDCFGFGVLHCFGDPVGEGFEGDRKGVVSVKLCEMFVLRPGFGVCRSGTCRKSIPK